MEERKGWWEKENQLANCEGGETIFTSENNCSHIFSPSPLLNGKDTDALEERERGKASSSLPFVAANESVVKRVSRRRGRKEGRKGVGKQKG